MRRFGILMAATGVFAAAAAMSGCDQRAPVDRVGTMVIEKSALDGQWYMSQTIIDFDYEAAGLGFVGETSGDGTGGYGAMPRVRWVIDEQTLYAYRDYQVIEDAADPYGDVDREGFLGQPVAAYRIEGHFDIRRSYNPTTGEEQNVIEENSTDQRWWERRFMRVDWSRNLIAGWWGVSTDLSELFGSTTRESVDLVVQPESPFNNDWLPQFHYMTCAPGETAGQGTCVENDQDWSHDYGLGELYHLSFVTQHIVSPGVVVIPGFGAVPNCGEASSGLPECASVPVVVRTSFLRVSDTREYQPLNYDDPMFDRAGYFRLERDTFDTSSSAGDPSWGFTDFRNLAANRHNIWLDWVDEAGNPVPYADRGVRQVVWYTTPELPAHLVRPAFEVASEWNSVLMGVVRQRTGSAPQPTYPRVQCQMADPDDYCYCTTHPDTGEVLQPDTDGDGQGDCAGIYDPFETPEAAAARGVVSPFQCHVEVPAGAEPDAEDRAVALRLTDSSYDGWFGARMVGDECVNVLRVNSCNLAAVRANGGETNGLDCQLRGDNRFSFLSYVDVPGTPFLGVAVFRTDPITGEMLGTDANIGGPALQSVRTRAMQAFDLINGTLSEQEFFTGEDIRAYLESANRIDLPAPPRIDFSVALREGMGADPAVMEELESRMDRAMDRAERLQGPEGRAQIFHDRLQSLAHTRMETELFANEDTFALAGLNYIPNDGSLSPTDDAVLDRFSPFRLDPAQSMAEAMEYETRLNVHGMHMPNSFVDDSVLWFVNQHRSWPRARVEFELNRRLYRQTEIHEMGHCMGLRHDFSASADTGNYAANYYLINEEFPLPDPRTFDRDGTPGLSPTEQRAYDSEYEDTRELRELAGIDAWMNSSIMEYTANWYERIQGSGHHDWMAVALGYGNLVDVYYNSGSLDIEDVNPANTPRVWATYYQGGESCTTDDECPYASGGRLASELTDANRDGNLTQRCVAADHDDSIRQCSNFDDDARAILAAGGSPQYVPVMYRYCEDYRAGTRTLPYCNTFDEGDSFREMVRNAQEGYERAYIFSAFRRYRRSFSIGGYLQNGLLRFLFPLLNVQGNLLYRYANDPEFRTEEGAFGFADQFLATADILNFYMRILGSPNLGAYSWDAGWERYERTSSDPNAAGTNLSMPLGLGRYFQSVYQAGLTGINRIERIGSFYDKVYTLILMTSRGLTPFYGPDSVFWTNLYDLFPDEINQIFTGMIADQPEQYMPRLTCGSGTFPACRDPRIQYMDFYRGDCGSPDSTTCRPHPAEITYRAADDDASRRLPNAVHVLNGGSSFLVQNYAAIFGLAEMPVYYDTTFEAQMYVCVLGRGECQSPVDEDGDGTDDENGVSYIRHTSDRFGQTYVAWNLEPGAGRVEQRSVAFSMILEAANNSCLFRSLREYRGDFGGDPRDPANITDPTCITRTSYTLPTSSTLLDDEIDRFDGRLRDIESFLNYLIQLQRFYGVNFPQIYRRPEL